MAISRHTCHTVTMNAQMYNKSNKSYSMRIIIFVWGATGLLTAVGAVGGAAHTSASSTRTASAHVIALPATHMTAPLAELPRTHMTLVPAASPGTHMTLTPARRTVSV